jgi:hypothetical protein
MGKMKELYILAQDISAPMVIELIKQAEQTNSTFVMVDGRQVPIDKAKAMVTILESTISNKHISDIGDA